MKPAFHITVATKAKCLMSNCGCSTFSAFIEPSRPSKSETTVKRAVLLLRKHTEIFRSIIKTVPVFVMDNEAIWNRAKMLFRNSTVLENPTVNTGTNFAKSVVVSAFAAPHSECPDWFFRHPGLVQLMPKLRSTFWRTCLAAQWSVSFENLSTNWATTEVLSHAAE